MIQLVRETNRACAVLEYWQSHHVAFVGGDGADCQLVLCHRGERPPHCYESQSGGHKVLRVFSTHALMFLQQLKSKCPNGMTYSEDNEFPVTQILWYAVREISLVSGIAHSETVVNSIFQTLSLDVRKKRL